MCNLFLKKIVFLSYCIYFIGHTKNTHGPIPISTSHHLGQVEINGRSMYFRNAMGTDIIEPIIRLNKGGGINDCSRKFLVICKNLVSYYLKEPFNFCITSDVYPNVYKNCSNTTILKKGYPHNISNYRPVSVLSNLSKVFENLIYNSLQSFLSNIKFFC